MLEIDSQIITTVLDELSKKGLIKKMQFPCFEIPSFNITGPTSDYANEGDRENSVPSQNFFGKNLEKY